MVFSNERTQGAKHQHLRAFPWVQLSFNRKRLADSVSGEVPRHEQLNV
jgi:hypothetical protein